MTVRNLSVLSYSNGFTLWHYKGDVTALQQLNVDGGLDSLLAAGDMVLASTQSGGKLLVVVADDAGDLTFHAAA